MQTVKNETWIKKEDGTMMLVAIENVELPLLTQEEIISEKEAALLAMYEELQALKNNTQL